MIQIAQDISSRVYVKKCRRSGLRRGFLACINLSFYYEAYGKGNIIVYLQSPLGSLNPGAYYFAGRLSGQFRVMVWNDPGSTGYFPDSIPIAMPLNPTRRTISQMQQGMPPVRLRFLFSSTGPLCRGQMRNALWPPAWHPVLQPEPARAFPL